MTIRLASRTALRHLHLVRKHGNLWGFREFVTKRVSSSVNAKSQRGATQSFIEASVNVPKAVPTNIAYETHLKNQFESPDRDCVNELILLRREVLRTKTSNVPDLQLSLGTRMASVIEHTMNIQSTITGFAPAPQEFVDQRINSLMKEFVQTELESEGTRRSRPPKPMSITGAEGHLSKRLLVNSRSKQGKEILKVLCGSNNEKTLDTESAQRKMLYENFPVIENVQEIQKVEGTENEKNGKRRNQDIKNDSFTTSTLLPLWEKLGGKFFVFNEYLCPETFQYSSTLSAYHFCRNASVVFDLCFKRHIRFSGRKIGSVLDRFIGCRPCPSQLGRGEVRYGCILDSEGKVMDTCWILKEDNNIFYVITTGFESSSLNEFLKTHFKYLSRGKKKILHSIDFISSSHILGLQGPKSSSVLSNLLNYSQDGNNRNLFLSIRPPFPFHLSLLSSNDHPSSDENISIVPSSSLSDFPYMSSFQLRFEYKYPQQMKNTIITCLRIGTTGEDGFEIVVDKDSVLPFTAILLWSRFTREGGLLALDILRMEAGFCLPGYDFTRVESTVQAGLVWALDPQLISDNVLFGSSQIQYQLSRSTISRIVGLVCEETVFPGCQVLSFPNRAFLGSVKSACWSPAFNRRLVMASISNDAVLHGQIVLIQITAPSDQSTKQKFKGRRGKPDPDRKLVKARIAQLPFVPHHHNPDNPRQNPNLDEFRKMKQTSYKGFYGSRLLRSRQCIPSPNPTPFEKPRKIKAARIQKLIDINVPELKLDKINIA